MKKIKTTSFAVFLFAVCAVVVSAQEQFVKKEDYLKAVSYLNCETVKLSLKDNAETNKEDGNAEETFKGYTNKFPCSGNSVSEKIIDYLKTKKMTGTVNLAEEIETVADKSFKENWKPEDAVKFLSNEVFNDGNYKKLNKFANDKTGKPNYENYKKELSEKLPAILTVKTNETTETTDAAKSDKKTDTNSESGFGFWSLVPWLILSLLVIYIGWNEWTMITVKEAIGKLNEKDNSLTVRMNNLRKPPVTAYSSSRSDDAVELRNELADLRMRFENLAAHIQREKKETESRDRELREIRSGNERNLEIFYLSTPNSDETFNVSSAHNIYQKGSSIYRFTKDIYGNTEFQIDENPASVKQALNYPEQNIAPVCTAKNAFNPNANRIITTSPGKAVLEGDYWRVEKKAEIEYE